MKLKPSFNALSCGYLRVAAAWVGCAGGVNTAGTPVYDTSIDGRRTPLLAGNARVPEISNRNVWYVRREAK